MEVKVWLDRLSQPIVIDNVESTYQKGDMFCVLGLVKNSSKRLVTKFPMGSIFRVQETYE